MTGGEEQRGRRRFAWPWRGGAAAEARRQEALAELGLRALEGAERKELIEYAAVVVARILDVPYSAVLAWDTEGRLLRVQAGAGWRAGVVGRLAIDTAASPGASDAWGSREPVAWETLDAIPGGSGVALLRAHDIASGLRVAIAPQGRVYGVLAAFTDKRRRFAAPELAFVGAVGRLLAIAIGREYGERALFEEMQMSTVLAHVGRELMACTDPVVLLDRTCELTASALRCDHSVVWLRSTAAADLRAVAAHGFAAAHAETLAAMPLPSAAIETLLAELATRDTVRVTAGSNAHPVLGAVLGEIGVRVAVVAALRKGDTLVGLQMSGQRDAAGVITAHDERVAHGIVQLASVALMNARVLEELARASQLKSEFVSTMSHELRTPLNIIIGYTEMLRDVTAPAEQAPLLEHVRKASEELLELIDGTLNLNRIAAGGDAARFTPVVLGELWRELAEDFAALAPRSGVALHWHPVAADLVVHTDRRKLKIVLKNLVGNALKFTPAGEVAVACEPVGDRYRLTVRDTGIGIPVTALPHVFEMFRQVDSSETRSYGGAGLGLYIVKSLLTQLGGDVQVESLPGQGSIFTVVLPIAEPTPVAAAANGSPTAAAAVHVDAGPAGAAECPWHTPRRLLFADDLPLNRLLVRRFVAHTFPTVDVLEATDGQQAVAMFDVYRPHIVLLDLHMPELDGWQAARAIRRRAQGLHVPILALSVDASPGAETNAVRAGFQEFIAKPISDYSALEARLRFWLAPRDGRGRELTRSPIAGCEACRSGARRASAA